MGALQLLLPLSFVMRYLLGIFCVAVLTSFAAGRFYWRPWTFRGYSTARYYWNEPWTSTGTVPDKLSEVPPEPLHLTWSWQKVVPNAVVQTSTAQRRPWVWWNADPNALYTLMLEDNDITAIPIKYAHWLVTNIPGNAVAFGDEVMEYIPPFRFTVTKEGVLSSNTTEANRHLALVYKQSGRIDYQPRQSGCNPDIGPARAIDHDEIKEKFNMEGPVAGTFYRSVYEPVAT